MNHGPSSNYSSFSLRDLQVSNPIDNDTEEQEHSGGLHSYVLYLCVILLYSLASNNGRGKKGTYILANDKDVLL